METAPGMVQRENPRDAQGTDRFITSFEEDALEEDAPRCYTVETFSPAQSRERGGRSGRKRHDAEDMGVPLQKGQGKGRLIGVACTALGTPYVRGGTSRQGFDCSGFVQWSYRHVGIHLPRTAAEQARVGRRVSHKDMQPGDIVTFHHPKRGYHSGIYVGDGKFIHSPRTGSSVRINSLDDPYFSKSFLSARRVKHVSSADLADAEQLLANYDEKRFNRPAPRVRSGRSGVRHTSRALAAGKRERGKRESYVVMSSRKKEARSPSKEKRAPQKTQAVAAAEKSRTGTVARKKQQKQQVTAQNTVQKSKKSAAGGQGSKNTVRKKEAVVSKQHTADRKVGPRKTGSSNKTARNDTKQSMRS